MGANSAPDAPQEGGDLPGGRLGALAALRRALPTPPRRSSTPGPGDAENHTPHSTLQPPASRFRRPSPLIAGLCAATCAVALVGGLTYFAARAFTGEATESRASDEALSFAEHSSTLATGDAFIGYLQILRYAEDGLWGRLSALGIVMILISTALVLAATLVGARFRSEAAG